MALAGGGGEALLEMDMQDALRRVAVVVVVWLI